MEYDELKLRGLTIHQLTLEQERWLQTNCPPTISFTNEMKKKYGITQIYDLSNINTLYFHGEVIVIFNDQYYLDWEIKREELKQELNNLISKIL